MIIDLVLVGFNLIVVGVVVGFVDCEVEIMCLLFKVILVVVSFWLVLVLN